MKTYSPQMVKNDPISCNCYNHKYLHKTNYIKSKKKFNDETRAT